MRPADYITFLNIIAGMLTIFLYIEGYDWAPFLLFLAVLFDFLDGKIARKTRPTELGRQLDSLADIVSFCVAPAVITGYAGVLLVLAGAYRLARFNIKNKKDFEGMPVTLNGIIAPIVYYLYPPALPFYAVFASIAMISRKRIKKL